MKAAFTQLQRISANDPGIERAKQICGASLVDSMKPEEIIVTCIFANFEKFCGIESDSGGFSTFINNVRWDLPDVPWSWDAQP